MASWPKTVYLLTLIVLLGAHCYLIDDLEVDLEALESEPRADLDVEYQPDVWNEVDRDLLDGDTNKRVYEQEIDTDDAEMTFGEAVDPAVKFAPGLVSVSEAGDPEVKFAPGLVSQACLGCICKLESQCKPIGCHMDVGSLSCGYFQIKVGYWTDCGRPGTDWKSCADDIQCSSQCVQNYMRRYASYYRCPATCEGYAREHNGGPNGCHNPRTIPYWNKLKRIPGCQNM
ncbi:invertebrate-type lysozyme-like isoform X2 [Dreissena polymorpha]|uniref:invertebrate-type lysozyme-like isoform X2 n=1 Tax=Dreissena polymorpha TaxID=45954 RepID=UPI002264EEEC|nr:invertebrate-type lysozyme-like isoform X2 [Dreissena polymorpha]